MHVSSIFRGVVSGFIVLLLGACGGGGSGGGGGGAGPTTPTTILTSSNAAQAASDAYGAMDTAGQGGGQGFQFFSTTGTSTGQFDIAHFSKKYLQYLSTRQQGPALVSPMTVYANPIFCSSGQGSVSWDDADENGVDSSGDTYVLSFTNCVDLGETLNGQVTIGNFQVTGDPTSTNFSLSATISINLTIVDSLGTMSLNGAFTVTMAQSGNALTMSISSSSLTMTDNGETLTIGNFTVTFTEDLGTGAYTIAFDGPVTSTDLGGTVVVDTTLPFAGGGSAYPTSGSMTISGANNTRVVVTVVGVNSVQLQIDADGNGTLETTQMTTWSALSLM